MLFRQLKYILPLLALLFFVQCSKEDTAIQQKEPQQPKRTGNYYVAVNGNDNNPGTKNLPFKSITKGVSVLTPGKTLIVSKGEYNEFIDIATGGNKKLGAINIYAEEKHAVRCWGFRIFKNADFVTINGFKISSSKPNYSGIWVYGKSNIEIADCYIYECPTGGIKFFKNAAFPIIRNNTLEHNGFFGIYLNANHAIVKNNTISKTVQFHRNCNPDKHPGADADGIVVFGGYHQIVGNKIIDIGNPSDSGNKNPHSDCIQTSKINDNTVLQNSTICNNYFRVKHPSGKGIIMEPYSTNCKNISIYNNIFEVTDIGIAAYNGVYNDIKICNNIFKTNLKQKSWGTAVYLKNINNYQFINNITIDCKNEHRKIIGGTGKIAHNLAYNSDNSPFSMTPKKQATEIAGKSPNFVKYTGIHGENNYHLLSTSPAIDKGQTVSFIKTDKENTKRPQGNGYDIGVYEYK